MSFFAFFLKAAIAPAGILEWGWFIPKVFQSRGPDLPSTDV